MTAAAGRREAAARGLPPSCLLLVVLRSRLCVTVVHYIMAAPVPFRTNENKYTPSFPPIVYYRDTFGLEPVSERERRMTESGAEGSDNDSIVTKSTVRTTMNVQPFAMCESTGSKYTNMTPSYHVEQLLTNHVLTADPRTLLTLTLVASCVAASLSFVQSVALFFWTAYLVNNEDKYLERIGANENRIVTSTRIAMYSLQMIFAPIHAIAAAITVFVLYDNMRSLGEEKVTRGYFLSEPQLGHQGLLLTAGDSSNCSSARPLSD
ncbi:unnamed protein product [Heligmosomoides polygyrus]|uniref:ABC transmembrane type-1 domain-containing protein n=1 Tax=Heligmosomoides polygyrus TaxID=6339 RepID=A0A3P7X2S8_HELPZ|nr:unnamed protein product [Heligmosomoides polygyrus]